MDIIVTISKASIYVIFMMTLLAAVFAVTLRNIFRAALSLAFALTGVAGVYFVLHAEFLGAMQILLYVGAVMTLIIFVVMLTSRIGDKTNPTSNRQALPVLIGALLLALFLIRLIRKTPWAVQKTLTTVDAVEIGKALMGPYVLPFELISLVLVVVLIGAIVTARSD